jgi:hypothetical protein
MPARTVTLYIREKDYRKYVKLLREKNTTHFEEISIYKDENEVRESLEEHTETDDVILNSTLWYTVQFMEGDKVEIIVHFIPDDKDSYTNEPLYYYKIDEIFMKSQMPEIQISPREFKSDKSKGFVGSEQVISFTMPNHDVELVIKELAVRFTLTVQHNEYQMIYYPDRRIEMINYKGESWDISQEFIIQEIEKTVIDLYVKFTDIYQHLDRDHLYDQYATLLIEESGNFDGTALPEVVEKIFMNVWNEPSQTLPGEILENNGKNRELWQHIRLKMPSSNSILDLQWIERLVEIDLDVNHEFVDVIDIFDTNKLYDIAYNGDTIQRYQPRLPHYTYPYIQVENNISRNLPYFSFILKDSLELVTEQSWYSYVTTTNTIGIQSSRLKFDNLPSIISAEEKKISILAPKNDIYIFLKVGFEEGASILKVTGVVSSITLEPGIYTITVGGAAGGVGAEAGRDNRNQNAGFEVGKTYTFQIETHSVITINYHLGLMGAPGNAGRGNAGGGGGGGGGASIIVFNQSVIVIGVGTYKSIVCNGGRGGNGGEEHDRIGHSPQGGNGGAGGTSESGKQDGGNGGIGEREGNGTGGAGGVGGKGYARNVGNNLEQLLSISSSNDVSKEVHTDGHIEIRFDKRLEEIV